MRASIPSASAMAQSHAEPRHDLQRQNVERSFFERPSETAGATLNEVLFGPFRLLPAQFLLLERGNPVPVGSRALEILIVLLDHAGELVSKQELMAHVWPDIFVEPANLTVHISRLRRMLRDGQDGNRFIINIPGRGYSFVAPVEASGRGKIARNGLRDSTYHSNTAPSPSQD